MKKIIFCCLVLQGLFVNAQNRYLSEVFSSVNKTSNVTFSTNIPTVRVTNIFGNRLANEDSYGQATATLRMDIYQPVGDTNTNRPVIIFAFGGGFVNGSRTESSMIKLCEAYAKRGFVTATIDYRLGMNLSDEELSKRAVYRATQDGRSAVRFFRKNAATYKVDPNKIFISGHSAGAFLALHNIYLDKDSERPASTRSYFGRADLGGLDAIGDNKTYSNGSAISGKANGAISFAGAVGSVDYIENSSDVPAAYFHSVNDGTVPYNSGEPFSALNWLPGFNLPTVYGGNAMNNRANSINARHNFYSYTSRGHNVHFTWGNLYSDIAPLGSEFLYNNFLSPSASRIIGNEVICSTCGPVTYTLDSFSKQTEWEVKGGKILSQDNTSVTVEWDKSVASKSINAIAYSNQLAKGVPIDLALVINMEPKIIKESNEIVVSPSLNWNAVFADPEGDVLTFNIYDKKGELIEVSTTGTISTELPKDDIIVEAVDENNCKASLSLRNYNGLEELVTAYPNPFTKAFTLALNFDEPSTVEIYDIKGMLVLKREVVEKSITINEIQQAGVYILKTTNSKGTSEQKIIKE